MKWLREYALAAAKTDRIKDRTNHLSLLAAGLMGEVGSIVAEVKKAERERNAYPASQSRILEELGDFLWYYARFTSVTLPTLLSGSRKFSTVRTEAAQASVVSLALDLAATVAQVIAYTQRPKHRVTRDLNQILLKVWQCLLKLSGKLKLDLRRAAQTNLRKTESRWPLVRKYGAAFDDDALEDEQLPRKLEVEFIERGRRVVVLRCNGINFGNRITDNIQDADNYRFHDIFHFSHAVHLGWSPVMRDLLSCKRKSNPRIDEAEDGARAGILEEAIAATVFSRAKELHFFKNLDHLDYDLLKTIQGFVRGYEVARIPLWQWETAILEGYRVFRQLRANRGGTVILDLRGRSLTYIPPATGRTRKSR